MGTPSTQFKVVHLYKSVTNKGNKTKARICVTCPPRQGLRIAAIQRMIDRDGLLSRYSVFQQPFKNCTGTLSATDQTQRTIIH